MTRNISVLSMPSAAVTLLTNYKHMSKKKTQRKDEENTVAWGWQYGDCWRIVIIRTAKYSNNNIKQRSVWHVIITNRTIAAATKRQSSTGHISCREKNLYYWALPEKWRIQELNLLELILYILLILEVLTIRTTGAQSIQIGLSRPHTCMLLLINPNEPCVVSAILSHSYWYPHSSFRFLSSCRHACFVWTIILY